MREATKINNNNCYILCFRYIYIKRLRNVVFYAVVRVERIFISIHTLPRLLDDYPVIRFFKTSPSNRRHLLSRKTGNRDNFVRWEEELDERISISDRFGISIGFYECDQNLYLEIVRSYAKSFNLNIATKELDKKAIEWQVQRGSRSGRVAKQFIISLLSNST